MFYGFVGKISADAEPEVRIRESERAANQTLIEFLRTLSGEERRVFLETVSLIRPVD